MAHGLRSGGMELHRVQTGEAEPLWGARRPQGRASPRIWGPFNRAATSLWACSLLEAVLRYDLRNEIVPVVKCGQIIRGEIVSLRAELLLTSFLASA
jgi:hypothetical protein